MEMRPRKAVLVVPDNDKSLNVSKLSNAEKQKRYRENLKLRPDYLEIRKKNAEKAKEKRLKEKSDAEIAKIREGNRIRAQRYRDKQKNLGIQKVRPKPKTRQKLTELREYWRVKKQESRCRLSGQKKRRVKEKDRNRKMSQNKKRKTKSTRVGQVFSSPSAEEKATQRVKQYLPKCPKKMARVVMNIISKASPKKRAALSEQGITTPKKRKLESYCFNNIKGQIFRLKGSNKKSDKALRRALVSACIQSKVKSAMSISRHLGIKWSYLKRCSELNDDGYSCRIRSDKIPEETTEDIKDFFLHPHISTPLPDKRLVNKDGKAAHIMHRSLLDTFEMYKEKNPSVKVGKSKFASLRPKNVKTFCDQQMQQCLCEYCLNVELKLKAVNKLIERYCENVVELKIKDKYCAVNMVACPKEGKYHKKNCIDGLCISCGEHKMRNHLKDVKDKYGVEYYVWKTTEGKERKKGLVLKKSDSNTLIDELCSEVSFLKKHLFNAHWQLSQFQKISQNPPENCVVAVLDFGRNYVCEFQDEPQFLHWIHTQVTVHPVVCYYKCKENDCNNTVKEDLVFLSEDIRHDAHAVNWFENKTIEHLKENKIQCYTLFEFTDGCSSQYKSKIPFSYICNSNLNIHRSYFGSRHGKGPGDQVVAVVKSKLSRAVKSHQAVISDAESAVHFLTQNRKDQEEDHQHHKTKFFLVGKTEIDHDKSFNCQTVSGTQKIHSIKGHAEDPNMIQTRNLTCFCEDCLLGNYNDCTKKEYVDEWKVKRLMKVGNEQDKCSSKKGLKKKQVEKNIKRKQDTPTDGIGTADIETVESVEVSDDVETAKGVGETVDVNPIVFPDLYEQLNACAHYDQVEAIVKDVGKLPPVTNQENVYIVSHKRKIDKLTLPLVTKELVDLGYYPTTIYGDGNCLARCASLIAYGSEEHFKEMRIRIVFDMVQQKQKYLDDRYLEKGGSRKKDIAKQFAMFSPFYMAQNLSKVNIKSIFEQEILSTAHHATYMGIWQVAAISNVLQREVVSVYPDYTGITIRNDLHRHFFPFIQSFNTNIPAYIMWTNTGGIADEPSEWVPNHFVVLLQMEKPREPSDEDITILEEQNTTDLSMDLFGTDMISTVLQNFIEMTYDDDGTTYAVMQAVNDMEIEVDTEDCMGTEYRINTVDCVELADVMDRVDSNETLAVDGNGTTDMDRVDGNATPDLDKADGNGTPDLYQVDSNGTPDIGRVEGNGTPDMERVDGNGTPDMDIVDGNGTPDMDRVDGNGTPDMDKVDGNGTPDMERVDGNGTLAVIGSGTPDMDKVNGNGTPDMERVDGNGTPDMDKVNGNGTLAVIGNGTPDMDKVNGNGTLAEIGNGTPDMDRVDGNGTPDMDKVAGNGTPAMDRVDGNGTPDMDKVDGNGTPDMDKVDGNGTPDMDKVDGNGTPDMDRVDGYGTSDMDKVDGNGTPDMDKVDDNGTPDMDRVDGNSTLDVDKVDDNGTPDMDRVDGNSTSDVDKVDGNGTPAMDRVDGNGTPDMDKVDDNGTPDMDRVDGNGTSDVDKVDGNGTPEMDRVDGNGTPDMDKVDGNGTPDMDKVDGNGTPDMDKVNGNGTPDMERVDGNGTPDMDKVNGNGTPDMEREDGNGTPDMEREDGNGTPDMDKVNVNGTPDIERVDGNGTTDMDKVDGNGTPDMDIVDGNGTPDMDKVDGNGTPEMDRVDGNGTPDMDKVDGNGTPDMERVDGNGTPDMDRVDGNGTPDMDRVDVDGNGIPEMDIVNGNCKLEVDRNGTADMDGNGTPDMDRVDDNGTTDMDKVDGNGTPDMDIVDGNGTPDMDRVDGYGTPDMDKVDGNGTPEMDRVDGNGTPDMDKVDGNGTPDMDRVDGNGTPDMDRVDGNVDGNGIPEMDIVNGNCKLEVDRNGTADMDGNGTPDMDRVDDNGTPDMDKLYGNGTPDMDRVDGNGTTDFDIVDGNGTPDMGKVDGNNTPDMDKVDGNGTPDMDKVDGNGTPDMDKVDGNGTPDMDTADGNGTSDGIETTDDTDNRRLMHNVGDFVLVRLPAGAKKHHNFVAEIIDIVDGEYLLRYLQKTRYGYKWPVKEDISQEPVDHIIQQMSCPKKIEKFDKTFFEFEITH